MNDRVFAVDLQSGYNDLLHVGLSQYDVGVVLEFDVFDGGAAAVFPSGTTAKIQGVRPSGVGFDISCTLSGNIVTVSTVTDMTGEAGSFPVEIRFTASGVDVGTVNFVFQIEKAAHPDGTIDADITHEQDIVDKINQILIQTTPDTTLSEAGVAADSKTVGDNINRIDRQIGTLGTRITNVEDDISYQSQRIDRTNKIKAPVIWEEASGNLAVFDDGADGMYIKDLTLTLTPSQDLHGYDYAWAGGNGKNKLNIPDCTITSNGVTATISHGVITLSGMATADGWIMLATDLSFDAGTYTIRDFASRSIGGPGNRTQFFSPTVGTGVVISWDAAVDAYKTGEISSASDYFARIRIINSINYDGVVLKPMLVIGSTAPTEFEPYENICPISGAESVTVKRTGKNLLKNEGTSNTVHGVEFTFNTDGTVTVNGTADALYDRPVNSNFLPPVGTYTFSGGAIGTGNTNMYIFLRKKNGSTQYVPLQNDTPKTFDVTDDVTNMGCSIRVNANQTYQNASFKPMIRPASISDDTYAPYDGLDTNVDFGQTIYGGTVNPILWNLQGGDIVFDRKVFSVGELTWTKQSGNIFKATPDNVTGSASYDLSDTFRRNPVADSAMQNGDFKLTVAGTLYVKMEGFGTAAGFKAAYADAKFCAKLAHSEIGSMYTNCREITTAYLNNVITAQPDKGNVTNIKATYPADTKAYIDKAIAAISG